MKLLLLVLSTVMLFNLTACTSSPTLPVRLPMPDVSASDASTIIDAPPATVAPEGTPAPSSAFGTFYDLSFVPPEHWPKVGPDPHEGDVPQGEISIAAMDGLANLKDRAEMFMKKYPQADVIIQDYSEGGTVFDSQKYRSQISTQLMSGEGPDIVDVGMLGFPLIADKGFFVDLYEFIEKDKYIPRESFYQGILHEDRPYGHAWFRGCVDANVPFRARNHLAIS